jgi:hypothetical protein
VSKPDNEDADEDADEDEDEDEGEGQHHSRISTDSAKSYELYTPDEDRAVVRKLDRRLVVFLAGVYMLSFLDRSSEFFSMLCSFILKE